MVGCPTHTLWIAWCSRFITVLLKAIGGNSAEFAPGKPREKVTYKKRHLLKVAAYDNTGKMEYDICDPPFYVDKATRSIRPDIAVIVGICTHLGFIPK